MTTENRRRLLLYPVFLVLLCGLCYAGFVYRAEPDVATLVNSAEILAQAGAFEDAIRNAERALRQDPDARYAHIILGYCKGATGRQEEAVVHYRRAVDLSAERDDHRETLRLYLADALLSAGRPEEAEETARDVLAADPGARQARYLIGKALRARGLLDEAFGVFGEAAAADPGAVDPVLLMAGVEEERGRPEAALELLDSAAESFPGSPPVLLRRARLLALAGDGEAAVADLLRVAERHLVKARDFLAGEPALRDLRDDPRLVAALHPGKN